ncbi:hypothetical protein KAT51_02500 [bacterium]|nr:hypothetical protein [bacterium]
MKNSLRLILVAMVVLLIQIDAVGNGKTMGGGQEITLDPRIQAQIECIASAAEDDKETHRREISKLRKMEGSLEHHIQQLIYFQLNKIRMHRAKEITYDDMEQAVLVAEYISCILVGIRDQMPLRLAPASAQSVINAVSPYLGTKDPDLLDLLHTQLLRIDALRGDDELDYSYYESFIKERKKNPPLPLIQYMYEKSPSEALLTLSQIYIKDPKAREPLIRAEQIISADIKNRGYDVDRSQAVKALEELSHYKEWWVRLYVAEIIQTPYGPVRYYKLVSPGTLEKIKKDSSPLVRAVFSRPKKR